jgi:hypothetical protein
MKRTKLILTFMLLISSIYGQDIFKTYGIKEPLTLSKGRYKETFTNDEVVQIGTVLLNTKTQKIIKFLEEDTTVYAYKAEFTSRWLSPDPLAEKYPELSPYVYCTGNPLRFIDPNGMDWYSYEEKYKDDNGDEQTRTRYKYFDHELSKKEMQKGGYTHLGKTHTEGNTYYSLFGNTMDLRTQQGQIYQKVDEAVIAYGHNKEINNPYNPNRDPFDTEVHNLYGTDMSIAARLQGTIEYEGSISGFYNQYTGWGSSASRKAAMTGNVVNLFDGMYTSVNGVRAKVPFQIHGGGFGKATASSPWLLMWNGITEVTDIPNTLVGFQYSKEQAEKMLAKFYKLFPYAK